MATDLVFETPDVVQGCVPFYGHHSQDFYAKSWMREAIWKYDKM